MKTTFKILMTMLIVMVMIFACKKDDLGDGYEDNVIIYVENDEETMPVYMFGNTESEYLILVFHWHFGDYVTDLRRMMGGTAFKKLENEFLVAYWSFRSSGYSTGPDDDSYLTIAQFVEDADVVIDELKKSYPGKKIVIFGTLQGGMVATSYLKDSNHRTKVTAWINAAAEHNGTILLESLVADIISEADRRIQISQKTAYWEQVKNTISINDTAKCWELANQVVDSIPEVTVKMDFSLMRHKQPRGKHCSEVMDPQVFATNNTPYLLDIDIPVLVLWGKYNFAVSKTIRDEFIANIGTSDITNVEFNASGFATMFHEPELFVSSVKDFIYGLD